MPYNGGSLKDILVSSILLAHGNVRKDACREQDWHLAHKSNVLSQPLDVQPASVGGDTFQEKEEEEDEDQQKKKDELSQQIVKETTKANKL